MQPVRTILGDQGALRKLSRCNGIHTRSEKAATPAPCSQWSLESARSLDELGQQSFTTCPHVGEAIATRVENETMLCICCNKQGWDRQSLKHKACRITPRNTSAVITVGREKVEQVRGAVGHRLLHSETSTLMTWANNETHCKKAISQVQRDAAMARIFTRSSHVSSEITIAQLIAKTIAKRVKKSRP